MKAFVTGARGFVGQWLCDHLRACGDEVVVPPEGFDLRDPASLRTALVEAEPDAVFHLAARSHVGQSWKDPAGTFQVNATGTLHLLDAALACSSPPTVLLVSSSEVYGTVGPDEVPVGEGAALRPVTPYAASKIAAEFLGIQAHLGTKLPVVISRSFNHVGPGQADTFVISAFAKRIVEAKINQSKTLRVGNLEARRDFTDVRDVVRAYRLLVEKGVPGEIYNVCSGRDVSIAEIANSMLRLAEVDAELETDPALLRPVELPLLKGDATKLFEATQWSPEISLEQTIRDTLTFWENELRSGPSTGARR